MSGIPHTVCQQDGKVPEDIMLETAATHPDTHAANPANAPNDDGAQRKLTDGFHLVIEALTLK